MGKASRRKRERMQLAEDSVEAKADRAQQLPPRVMAGIVVLLVIGLAGWFHYTGSDAGSEPASVATMTSISGHTLPNPDVSEMTVPVRRAIAKARQEALANPRSAAAVGRFGQVLHAHWRHDEALNSYEMAHHLDPQEFRWIYLLAGVEEIRGASGERIDLLFSSAIQLAPRFPPAYVRRADALLRLGRWNEARDDYATAINLDSELVLAQRGMGQAAILLGDGQNAVSHLERAAGLSPEDRITQVALARAYTLVGEGDLAAEAARKAESFKLEIGLPDPIFFEVEELAVDPVSLRSRLKRNLRAGDFDAAFEMVVLLEESNAGASARQQLTLATKQQANQLAFAGEFDAALIELERAARLDPADPEIEHNWGTVLLRRNELNAAALHFERAIQLNPQSADSLYNLGVVLEGLGRSDEAIERFTAAAVINPQHAAAQRLAELSVSSDY